MKAKRKVTKLTPEIREVSLCRVGMNPSATVTFSKSADHVLKCTDDDFNLWLSKASPLELHDAAATLADRLFDLVSKTKESNPVGARSVDQAREAVRSSPKASPMVVKYFTTLSTLVRKAALANIHFTDPKISKALEAMEFGKSEDELRALAVQARTIAMGED